MRKTEKLISAMAHLIGVKKRCRKSDHFFVECLGSNRLDAMRNLKERLIEKLSCFKEVTIKEIDTVEVERTYYDDYTSITRPLLRQCDSTYENGIELYNQVQI